MNNSNSQFPILAVNAIIFEQETLLLTKRQDNGEWCLPGGLVEAGETVIEALLRELLEEICVKCIVERLVGVYSANNLAIKLPAKRNSIILAFQCRIVAGTIGISNEVSEVRFFDLRAGLPILSEYQAERVQDALTEKGAPFLK